MVPIIKSDNIIVPNREHPARKYWYPMEERHSTRVPLNRDLIGKEIRVSRIIVRAGYYWAHTDIDKYELMEEARSILKKKLQSILFPYKMIDDASYRIFNEFTEKFGESALNRCFYEARQQWIKAIYELPQYQPYKGFRTLWYVNIPDVSDKSSIWLKVTGAKVHRLGIYDAPYASQSYEGEWDVYSGGLTQGCVQNVYQVIGDVAKKWDAYFEFWEKNLGEVHPLDVLEVRDAN